MSRQIRRDIASRTFVCCMWSYRGIDSGRDISHVVFDSSKLRHCFIENLICNILLVSWYFLLKHKLAHLRAWNWLQRFSYVI